MWIRSDDAGNAWGRMAGKKKSGAQSAPENVGSREQEGVDPHPTPSRRDKQTIVPAFDPEMLAKELEAAADRPTITPPFDPSSYARIVDDHVGGARQADPRDTPRTITAATPVLPHGSVDDENSSETATTTIGRAMYGSYLQSDYPEALVLAERVLVREPDHALARLVAEGCRDRLTPPSDRADGSDIPRLVPSSVVRLRRPAHEVAGMIGLQRDLTSQIVLGQIDGVCDVAMLADLAGIPRPEALDRLHALLELGLLEVVNA
jgi:hypothetical protein